MWQRRVGFPSMGMAGWCGLVLGLAFWMPLAVLCGILWAACWLALRLASLPVKLFPFGPYFQPRPLRLLSNGITSPLRRFGPP